MAEEHVTISPEAHRRLRLFSAKYRIPMKGILNWFIYTLLDEEGDPQIESLQVALERIQSGESTFGKEVVNIKLFEKVVGNVQRRNVQALPHQEE